MTPLFAGSLPTCMSCAYAVAQLQTLTQWDSQLDTTPVVCAQLPAVFDPPKVDIFRR